MGEINNIIQRAEIDGVSYLLKNIYFHRISWEKLFYKHKNLP